MTNRVLHHLSRISTAELTPDRQHCVIQIETEEDKIIDLEVPLTQFGEIISFLAHIVTSLSSDVVSKADDFCPIPLKGLGIAVGKEPDESVLVIQTHGLEWTFSCPSERLSAAAEHFALTAKTMTAKGRPQ